MARTSEQGAGVERPTLRTMSSRWAEMFDHWTALTTREEQILAELRPLTEEIRRSGGYSAAATIPGPPPPPEPADFSAGVREKLGHLVPFRRRQPVAATNGGSSDKLKAKAAALSAELSDVTAAKDVLLPELRVANFEASAQLVTALRPEFDAIAARVVDALLELAAAWSAHECFVQAIETQGASSATLKRLAIDDDGRDPLVRIAAALRLAVTHGAVSQDRVPAELLHRR